MNIFRRELRAGLKSFLFWALGLFVLVFAGMVKSMGITADREGFAALAGHIPRIVQAVFGMEGIDVTTFGGYYAVLAQYAGILTAVFAVHLGRGAASRETVDKTYEFLFTRPRSRTFIFSQKLLAGVACLTAFCILDFVFSIAAAAKLGLGIDFTTRFMLFAVASWLLGLVFFAVGAMFSAAAKNAEQGARMGNAAVLAGFVLGVVHDMLEHDGVIRFLTLFRYFLSAELLRGELNPLFAVLCVAIAVICLRIAFNRFEKRDLSAV